MEYRQWLLESADAFSLLGDRRMEAVQRTNGGYALNEIGEPFELRRFSTADRANFSDEYLAVNPKGYIPALQIDGFILTENPAILTFLGRRFPGAGIYPSDRSEDAARCLELLAWSSNTVHVAFAQLFRPERFVTDPENHALIRENAPKDLATSMSEVIRRAIN